MSDETTKKVEPGYVKPEVTLYGDEHVRRYLASDGQDGGLWNNVPILLFTTKGRTSGEPRQHPIIFAQDGDNYILVASHAGNPKDPQWFRNIQADPHVQVQVMDKKFDAIARVTESPERERLWDIAAQVWPNYNVYTTRTTRQIPVVVLEPVQP
jgi:deazaflavin-dependent oxidoreductase (nitroreductase family)